MVILEFPSKAHVEAWFDDPDYKEAMAFRHAASTMHMLLLQEGSENTDAPDPEFPLLGGVATASASTVVDLVDGMRSCLEDAG